MRPLAVRGESVLYVRAVHHNPEADVPANRWSGGKTIGVIAVVAAIGAAAVASSIRDALEDEQRPRKRQAQPPPAASWTSATELALTRANQIPRSSPPAVDYVIDLNTGVMTPLPRAITRSVAKSKMGLPRYAASPDGTSLAYVGIGSDGSRQLFVADLDGSDIHQMTRHRSEVSSPAWSPDGRKIAYAGSSGDGIRNFFVLDVTTRASTRVAGTGRLDRWAQPQFMPDGSALLYGVRRALRTVPVGGGESTVLVGPRQGLEVGNGAISPDRSLVTMMGNEIDGPGAIRFVTRIDGTKKRSMGLGSSNPAGTWSPDGHRIACSNYPGKVVLVVDIDTGEASLVAKSSAAIWLNGHTLLVET
jgi:WD40 repeat protein